MGIVPLKLSLLTTSPSCRLHCGRHSSLSSDYSMARQSLRDEDQATHEEDCVQGGTTGEDLN